ncbi:hypothetical protein [Comamonas sp. NoAH]|uniref:hypothetical protein n=1 Tax=Comamonas halotolerans TaxID=3041496 RepID=UPI0024E177A3|nr:hypothetical protein [Comamonas sp. NoAH]
MFSQTLGVARKYGSKLAAAGTSLAVSGAVMAQEAPSWLDTAKEKATENGTAVVAVVGAIALAGLAIWGAKWGARKLGFL